MRYPVEKSKLRLVTFNKTGGGSLSPKISIPMEDLKDIGVTEQDDNSRKLRYTKINLSSGKKIIVLSNKDEEISEADIENMESYILPKKESLKKQSEYLQETIELLKNEFDKIAKEIEEL